MATDEAGYALSFAQEQLWFVDQLRSGTSIEYLSNQTLRLRGPLDSHALSAALSQISARHEILRTRYGTVDGVGVQIVDEPAPVEPRPVDLRELPAADRDARLRELGHAELTTPIDLRTQAPWRLTLVRLGPDDAALLVTVHHIAFDGWSWSVLARELQELYQAFCSHRPSRLEPPALQYADFAQWERDRWEAAGEVIERQRSYWRARLAGLEPLELATDHRRPDQWVSTGADLTFTVPGELALRLAELGRRRGATPFMVYLAAFQVLLARHSGQQDVAVGVSVSRREPAALEQSIGMFLNTVVLRADLSGGPSFAALLAQVRETVLGAHEHLDVPFERVVADLAPERDLSRNPVFQVGFALHTVAPHPFRLTGLEVTADETASPSSAFDLSLHLTERPDGSVDGRLIYPTSLFTLPRIARMAEHLLRLLSDIADRPNTPVHRLELLTGGELEQFDRWNRTDAASPELSLPELFRAQARATPDAVAVVAGDQELGYAELADRVRRLALHLRTRGVTRETPVGVALHRGTDLVTALLAVLTAGGVYVPLAPEYPVDRLAYMVADADIDVVLTEESLRERLPAGLRVVTPDDAWRTNDAPVRDAELPTVQDTDGAYVMYTSGSTGRPKGVLVPHTAIRNRVLWSVERYGLGAGDRLLQKTTIGFDAAMWEFLSPLVCGATVVMAPQEAHRDPIVMIRAVAEHGVTVLQLVPSVLRLLLAEPELAGCASLRLVCSAGEPLPVELCERLRAVVDVEVFNTYGPTECAIDSTAWRYEGGGGEGIVPIGHPLTGVRTYVVDRDDALVPVGVPGELCVGGIGLARGYLGQGAQTAERFAPNPFAAGPGERWYRTGDLVRRREDGALEFVARIDEQVKVRGVRIEPGEIEAELTAHPSVTAAAVTTRRSTAGDLELLAYVVLADGEPAGTDEIRAHLASRLPEAMVPSVVLLLDTMPLTPTGKVDRQRLPSPKERDRPADGQWSAPRTPTEAAVAALMAEVLEVRQVAAEDDFFALGGHSLVAIRLVLRLRREFGIKLTVGELFHARTVAALAARIDAARSAGDGPGVRPVPRTGELPLSFGQQRMWFLDQLEPASDEYLVPVGLRLRGPLDAEALRLAVDAGVARHEVLRTRYLADDGSPLQVIDPAGPVPFELVDLSSTPRPEERALRLLAEAAGRAFDLAAEWPLRVTVVRTAPEEHLVVLTLHHIAIDAWSTDLYLRDLDQAYRALAAGEPSPLCPQAVQYADFAAWQRGRQSAGETAGQLDYWRERLAGLEPLELPTDRLRSAVRDARGDLCDVELPQALGQEVAELARRRGVTPFVLMLAAFQVLLGRYTGLDDVAVGTPVAGRTRPETEELVGFFTNSLVIRTDLAGDPVFGEFLEQVHRVSAEAFSHQDVPFEHLVDALKPDRDLSRNPLFQVMFEFQHQEVGLTALGGAAVESIDIGPAVAKFDLTVNVTQQGDGRLRCSFEYATALFDRATVERLAGHYLTLLRSIVDAPDARLSALAMLTAPERHDLLTVWPDPDGDRLAALDPAEQHGLCVPQLFEHQVRQTPDAIAVVFGDQRISYADLNARANRFARRLRALGVGPETVVGSCLERSPEAVVVLLAVLKAGGVYVPFDPRHPAQRLEFMLTDAGAEVVVTSTEFADRLGGGGRRLLLLDEEEAAGRDSSADLPAQADPGNLAYIIYTSGSTGRPKGVMIEHRSYAQHCRVIADAYGITPGERVVLLSALTFDVAMDQIAATLVAGATVVVGDPVFWTPAELPARLAEHEVTIVEITPAYYRAMLESPELGRLTSLKLMNVGSDVVTVADAERWADSGLPGRFLCNYGPTEATVTCLLHPVGDTPPPGQQSATLPIGRPVAGTRAHVLDAELRPVPIGIAGELCLGGVRLARGYHRRAALTADRFVPDPLAVEPGQRLYRTGDLVRRRPDGVIEFLGRIDRQVKVRGLRIELGEIEAALAAHPAVQETVVIATEPVPGDRRLAAYLVARPGDTVPDVGELRTHLRTLLPEYMIPSLWVALADLPLTPSGKVDRKALPDPVSAGADGGREYRAPGDPVEEALADIWSELLGVERIGVLDDFFALGGNSLLATRVLAGIRTAFSVMLPLRLLFEATTVAALARAVTRAVEDDIAALTDDEVTGLLSKEGAR
ncbi:amino acid adenylation domain-containing protein [Streptomyces achromogenes]|uniref:amino acid adenylation domain-containing protein n=1 Tax=Streptomyces achromogenes TaxID=67255 RepID=UPI0036C19882